MKAVVCTQHDANLKTCAPEYRSQLKPVFVKGKVKKWVWPAGLEVEGAKAVRLVKYGLARPLDKECADAAGLTDDQLRVAIEQQEMAQLGIHSKEDQELYLAGVILGYEPDGKGGLKYIPGPNMAAYKAALGQVQEADDDE